MLLCTEADVRWVEVPGGPALGFLPEQADWPVQDLSLPTGAGLVLFTDGLFEGRTGHEGERLGEDGLLRLARTLTTREPEDFVDQLIGGVEASAKEAGGLDDDVAVMYLRWSRDQEER